MTLTFLSSMICRYALDVHTDRAEDVLTHKRLLQEAKIPENRPAFHVRAVQVFCPPVGSAHLDHFCPAFVVHVFLEVL